jgi:hypothetical protein
MSFFTDLFNPVFLMFLGILTIVLGLIIIYFESKMREQNHKISSMLSLVSSLAEEINNVKIGLNHLTMMTGGNFPYKQNINNLRLLIKKYFFLEKLSIPISIKFLFHYNIFYFYFGKFYLTGLKK